MSPHVFSLLLLLCLSASCPGRVDATTSSIAAQTDFKIGAFNVQLFGQAVMANQDIVDVLKQIIVRYDIILIQEIRDKSETAILNLLAQVNEISNDSYRLNISDRLGRTNSKEQYGFYYKKDRVEVISAYHYDDGEECPTCSEPPDQFQREPYVVLFKSEILENIEKFALVPIHTQPSDAVREIDFLADVYEDVTRKYNVYDMLILGDFNAACNYVRKSDWDDIRLWTEHTPEGPFDWLIPTSVDTTVSTGFCAYDRIVATGNLMRRAVVPGSAKAYYFDKELGVNETFTPQVSDHFPVEVELKGKVSASVKENSFIWDSFKVGDKREVAAVKYIRKIYLATTPAERALFTVDRCFKSSGANLQVKASRRVDSRDGVVVALKEFNDKIPYVLSPQILQVVAHRMAESALTTQYTHPAEDLPANGKNVGFYDVVVTCTLVTPYLCDVEIKTPAGLE